MSAPTLPDDAPKHYVVGDLQGCFDSFQQLLLAINFREGIDYLYLLGDIVNRGPDSLACLRWAATTPNVTSVLGNHDMHLLALASGNQRHHKRTDTLQAILDAEDRDQLLNWLRFRPFVIPLPEFKVTLVHAGIPPQWTLKQALNRAAMVEKMLQSDNWQTFAHYHIYGNEPSHWRKASSDVERCRYTINAFARMRLCSVSGRLEFKHKLGAKTRPKGLEAWFTFKRSDKNETGLILLGHWSTLPPQNNTQARCLDTGCLWGGMLSALCLENNLLTQVHCSQYADPRLME